MRNLFAKIPPVLFVLLVSNWLNAQNTASITGVVTDPSGAVIPGVHVDLRNSQTDAMYKTVTNSVGSYSFNGVKPGPGYEIVFTHDGFNPYAVSDIYMNVDATRTQDAQLSLGRAVETEEVSAASENVSLNTTDATIGNSFQVQMLNNLPVENRDSPSALFYQQPGVTVFGSVTGARADQTNITLDGVEMNDNSTGQFGVIVGEAPVDSVQEFRGVTGQPLASAGQGGGGQFELVTRSGSNHFHGALVEYHRDTDTEANDWFNNNAGVPRPPLVRNQFGGNIGGPILKNKAFFFFDYNGRRDARSVVVDLAVPMGTDSLGYRGGNVSYINSSGSIETLNSSQAAAFDPMGIGWDQAELALFQKRFPIANDLTGDVGDMVNTAGYRFNSPFPYQEDNYVQRVDYDLSDKMQIFGRGTFVRGNALQSPKLFPADPTYSYPFYDRSFSWVAGHNWQIRNSTLNQAYFGVTHEDLNSKVTYNPMGDNQYQFDSVNSPYGFGSGSTALTYPVLTVRDDFSWQKGRHGLSFGGTFKWETPNEFGGPNYNVPHVGVVDNTNFTGLSPNLRPPDISSDPYAISIYDSAFSTALGAFADTSTGFYYNNKGVVQPTGSGLDLVYRYYETEVYFADTWKVTPELTFSYGLRYQNYTVPYEIHGDQSAVQLIDANGRVTPFSFNQYWADRVKQSAAGLSLNTVLPFLQYIYGGKVNDAPGYYNPNNKMLAPRFAFAYNPGFDKKTVISGGAGVIYDHTIVNALQVQQNSYLFNASSSYLYGTAGDPTATLSSLSPAMGGTQRFSGISSPPLLPTAPNVTTPYEPYVVGTVPYGLSSGQFSTVIDPTLKNPYNIEFNFGLQHEFPQGYLLKATYMGRLGRRLLAEADASQLLEFPDNSGMSNQTMSQAMAGLTTQLRQNVSLGALDAIQAVTPQPWFEDVITPGVGAANGFNSNTQMIAYDAYPFPQRGDFADTMQVLSEIGFPNQILPTDVGMASQFADNTVWTNKGSSNYDALLVTLHKNAGYGLQFDLNYTWAHSIDNVSVVANSSAAVAGIGYICDVSRPRVCRGDSDFDVTQYLNGNFIYELPVGSGKSIGGRAPQWLNEAIGGWAISGLPVRRTGYAYDARSNAFVASFANNAPATLIGPKSLLKVKINGGRGKALNGLANPSAALAAFVGPTGFDIGARNNLRSSGFFNLDLGLGKSFPLNRREASLKFRCEAFNALNHPNFNVPFLDITEAEGVPFGTILDTSVPPDSDIASRVLQLSLRLEF